MVLRPEQPMGGHASVLSTNALTMGLDKASNGPANPQSINRYSYVLNGPVRWTDPTGHQYTCNAYVCGIPSGGNTGSGAPITGSGASTTTVIGAAAEYTLAHKANTSDENQNLPEVRQEASDDSLNDYPANPDDWRVPEGWTETSAGEKTGSKHRQWNGSNGKVRRWNREGSRV